MSVKMMKNGSAIETVGVEAPLLELVITSAGVKLKSPLPPSEVCKILQGIAIDVMFANFQPAEVSRIHPVTL